MVWFASNFRLFCSFTLCSGPLCFLLNFSGANLVLRIPEFYFRGGCISVGTKTSYFSYCSPRSLFRNFQRH